MTLVGLIAACRETSANNTMNVDENLTTTDVNAAASRNPADANLTMNATDLNASGSDIDVPAPIPPKKGSTK